MRNLPAGTVVAVRIVTSGRLLVALVGIKQLKEPKPDSKPVFRAVVQDKLEFRVTISEADDYLLVLNNRAGKETLRVEAEIRALRRQRKPPPQNHDKAFLDQKRALHFTPAGMRLPGLGSVSRTPKVPLAASTVRSTTSTCAL